MRLPRGKNDMTDLFLIDDIPQHDAGQLDDKRFEPGIFLKQRLLIGSRPGIEACILVTLDGY